MELLKIKHLTKKFGDTPVIHDLSLNVISGEFLAVVGPSGCGKTTLLRIIAGLEPAQKGCIKLKGEKVFDSSSGFSQPPHQRKIGMVFQNYALWPHMNIFRNIAYPLHIQGVNKKLQRQAVKEALAQVHLSGYENRYINEISGGEQQRVALARAIIMQPQILLLDEPLSNLDAHLREEMSREIKRLQTENRLTIIHVTHDQTEAMALADRIAVMNKGSLIQIGSPRNIYKHPKNRFVAGFMGESNILPCFLNKQENTVLLPQGEKLLINNLQGVAAGQITLSVRPEDVRLNQDGEGVNGKVKEITYQGCQTRCRLACCGMELLVRTSPQETFSVGEEVKISISRATVIPD